MAGNRSNSGAERGDLRSWASVWRLSAAHYAIFLGVYGVYGVQVCPLLDRLSLYNLLVPAAVTLAILFALRLVVGPYVARAAPPLQLRLWFWAEFGLFIAGGAGLAYYNWVTFGFPTESGAKVMTGFVIVGLYSAFDVTFEREMRLASALRENGLAIPTSARFLPYQTKFVIFSTINLAVVGVVVMMVVLKDLLWATGARLSPAEIQRAVLLDLSVVILVLGAYVTRAVMQYSKKTNAALAEENAVLERVGAGALDASVTVASNDEFGHMARLTNNMIGKLRDSYAEVLSTQEATISALVSLSAKRDNETGLHLKRTQIYIEAIAKALRAQGDYAETLTDAYIERLRRSAPLHDVGKVGVPDRILCKPGKLDDAEFAIMKTHAEIGAAALEDADRALGGSSFLGMARDIALTHHEKWDGSGYPGGLVGEGIPLSGRLMAIADVYDALRSPRVYKPAFSHEKARGVIVEGRAKHFDPRIVDAFLAIEQEIERISERLSDPAPAPAQNAEGRGPAPSRRGAERAPDRAARALSSPEGDEASSVPVLDDAPAV